MAYQTPVHSRQASHVDGLRLEPHERRVEKAFGDFYGVCSCGARSLPLVTFTDARCWECPRDDAETSVLKADLLWRRRVADASGLVRN